MDEDYDPFETPDLNRSMEIPVGKPTGSPRAVLSAESITARQVPFMLLIGKFHDLFWDLPKITTRNVDARLQEMYELLMQASASAGISRVSVPRLRECCGKKREWPDGTVTGEQEKKIWWGLGDIVFRITRFFGFKHCPACERRRKFLNEILRKKS